eukprot:CAMPEP_0170637678 /NCGR_PEP_ID=MMETSP0224-20130122/38559_1 /TAXON_ID=285029 /ORGANISM="Togula jolla, Strain CCCM 725" /LENGTH=112 /DNA_ID=CAMNT_0010967613 /DNA_START=77 /DNA_END=412 /DNA_ORIENTATION=+
MEVVQERHGILAELHGPLWPPFEEDDPDLLRPKESLGSSQYGEVAALRIDLHEADIPARPLEDVIQARNLHLLVVAEDRVIVTGWRSKSWVDSAVAGICKALRDAAPAADIA